MSPAERRTRRLMTAPPIEGNTMTTTTARYTLHGEVTHYPDNTHVATLWLNDDGLPVQAWTSPHSHSSQRAINAAANQYITDQHLPADTLLHFTMSHKTVGVLTPDCPGADCICHQPLD